MNPETKILSGIAGEYFVAGELSRRGYIASITLRNTAGIDILVSNKEKSVNIQVKTRCVETTDGWKMGSNPLDFDEMNRNIFYVFVEIYSDPNNNEIDYYIIPKNELNKRVENNFQAHLKTPRRDGKPRTTNLRVFRMKEYPEFQAMEYKKIGISFLTDLIYL